MNPHSNELTDSGRLTHTVKKYDHISLLEDKPHLIVFQHCLFSCSRQPYRKSINEMQHCAYLRIWGAHNSLSHTTSFPKASIRKTSHHSFLGYVKGGTGKRSCQIALASLDLPMQTRLTPHTLYLQWFWPCLSGVRLQTCATVPGSHLDIIAE